MKEEDKEYKWLTKEDLLKWCAVYKGEEQKYKACNNKYETRLWLGEKNAVDNYLDRKEHFEKSGGSIDEQFKEDYSSEDAFTTFVLAFIGRFCPYDLEELAKIYITKNPQLAI